MEEQDYMFDAPVPGESLTGELGAMPYEQPPQMPTVEENVDFYTSQILNPSIGGSIAAQLSKGRRVSDLAEIIVVSGVAEGRHTLDVGVLVLPVVMEMLALVGDLHGVKYDMGLTTGSSDAEQSLVELASSRISEQIRQENVVEPSIEMEEPLEEMEEPVTMETPQTGLMGRRV